MGHVKQVPLTNPQSPPVISPQAKENQLIAMAYERVEQRIRDGSASSQELVHFLKLGSEKNRTEMENLRAQNKLLEAKTAALEADKTREEKYQAAIEAMAVYTGKVNVATDEDLF